MRYMEEEYEIIIWRENMRYMEGEYEIYGGRI